LVGSGCMQEVAGLIPGIVFMNCSKCGEVCSCAVEPAGTEIIAELSLAEATVESPGIEGTSAAACDPDAWRDELAARLNRYRSRRKAPPPRYPSLKLPFAPLAYTSGTARVEPASRPIFEPNSNHALALDDICSDAATSPQADVSTEPSPPSRFAAPVQPASAKIIEFPRFAWAPPPPPPDQLAEPVGDQIRILEVPDFQPALPALGGINIEPVQGEPVAKQLGIDIPLAAGTFAVFWAAYQYLLIVYSGSTPGLRAAGLELSRFDGTGTNRSLRRWRVLGAYMSALSLGMGYAWVFLDEDSLCWHDRITGTHLGLKKRLASDQ
jgi:uncharacterized RDD family membrane protein YckC